MLYEVLEFASGVPSLRLRSGGSSMGKKVEEIVQVGAKLLLPDHTFQILVGSSYYSYVNLCGAPAPKALELLLLENA